MNQPREFNCIFKISTILITSFLLSSATWIHAQMPPSLPGDTYLIREVKPNAPCKFAPEYERIKSKKTDPRVAYIDLWRLAHPDDAPIEFYGLCTSISEQAGDNVVVFDRAHAFLHILWGDEAAVSDAVTYFASNTKVPGITLFVTRFADDWRAFVFTFDHSKWNDVTAKYLDPFKLDKNDYIVAPQYGRTARVLTFDGTRFRHKMWLTWDGTKFVASTAKKMPGWRCPDSYRYFTPSERKQYCQ